MGLQEGSQLMPVKHIIVDAPSSPPVDRGYWEYTSMKAYSVGATIFVFFHQTAGLYANVHLAPNRTLGFMLT